MISHSNQFAEFGQRFIQNLDQLWSELETSTRTDVELIKRCFPFVQTVPGKPLHLHMAEYIGTGDQSYFYILNENNQRNRNFFPDMVISRDTDEMFCAQIWQAYLLYHANHILPYFWHGGYSRCTFIFSEEDINSISAFKNRDWTVIAPLEELLPSVTILSDSTCRVVCHAWNEWAGLVRETYTYTLDGNHIKQVDMKQEGLYPHDCGIFF